ncbi:Beta 1-4 glucosyltransferase LgtF (UDP-glucose--Lipooligosaccharide beta 1-4 glucosyltransferase) [Vibrio nigripulchritudo SFn27]|uniref:Beta 1-4 glucosyltransferase LgtF (UDP-glucose--Lipooligosaccharide beta 1-4 glucosyltransferase) n=2 Tax=Vibrio nigripulchritudo TaxID=28173 RepID=U4KFQ0_9VIBR|nr:glycosyltransferase family 2 protein [Vibrio nigripulchritudo]CCN80367.1 Beta 1-4 glucosyltransferase LgtF (UDP-glucose--Lipooligosaccharide beta 1-4 glucosyltransferase) [Vibrio nigripulchritudo BLFn1]CCN91291.1 Beta 1-4 glucosyltransferase LgtF (UDP-glucose--Lipooligosaccharide beta 1-4 glucosyltransferase) [Vibrio nigripulchritudo SFn27]CCO59658.1 Beta 1-4 glucosyltransferase LgtF (UDP-glucose--Lipooligosaccharide beta 1-4 glucosyltransferase) [Vibrio nigripulchritudo]
MTNVTSSNRATIAAVIITKNEEGSLKDCLESLKWVDEIVIVDSGSVDKTESIAKQYTDKFYVNADWPGFGKQKQLAQSYTNCDWILAVDADERIDETLKHNILKMLEDAPENTVFNLNELTWVFGRFLKHSGWYYRHVRLYPNALTTYNDNLVHESVIIPENCQVADLDGDILHYSYQNLNHYLVKSAGYGKAWADQRQAKGKKASLSQGIVHALACFIKMYVLKRGFLDGKQGFLIALLSAHSTFIKYADLWARDNDQHYKL